MPLLPRMTRLPYALSRCSLPQCNRQAAFIAADGFKLCLFHANLFHIGAAKAEALRNEAKSFNLDAVGELNDNGDLIAPPSGKQPS